MRSAAIRSEVSIAAFLVSVYTVAKSASSGLLVLPASATSSPSGLQAHQHSSRVVRLQPGPEG